MTDQTKICAYFQTKKCEDNMHEKCEEVFENVELNLEAKCICRCHEENKIKVVPDSKTRAREPVASVSQKQMTFDEIGVANIDTLEDNR